MTLPLHGLTVIALEQAVAAPFATRQLADLGARVIKVERPGAGDFARGYDEMVNGDSSYFVWLNRGKESVSLDIKNPSDFSVLQAMIAKADVLVQNLAPGATARLGLGRSQLQAMNPQLISCNISGYGPTGPYRDKKAYDLLIQCETGLLSVTGSAEEPAKAGISIADIAAGMYAYTAVLTALYERERTGEGTHADVAMIDALGEWMSQPYLYARYGGQPPPRSGPRHASIAPYGPYRVKDAATVFIGVQNEREWRTLCQDVLADPALAEDPRFHTNSQRVRNNASLTELIETALAASSADEVTARLDRTGIANARLRDLHEFAAHPQLRARDRWRPVQTPHGEALSLLPAVHVEGRECAMEPVPAPGQHTAALLREFAPVPAGAENTRRPDSCESSDRI